MLRSLIVIVSCQLFHPVISPTVRGHKCALGGHREIDSTRRRSLLPAKWNFRRARIDKVYPWKVQNPEELWYVRPTTATPRVIWNYTNERCDYMRTRCMKAYQTGAVCARNIDYIYSSFRSYCAMDFQNCVARLDAVWSIAHMGYCVDLDMDSNLYVDMTYDQMSNNSKLKQMYIADLGDETDFESYATYVTAESTLSTTTAATTILYKVFNVTDSNGTEVTDEGGNFITLTERVTVPYQNVTDIEGNLMTDEDGEYITITETTTVTTISVNDKVGEPNEAI